MSSEIPPSTPDPLDKLADPVDKRFDLREKQTDIANAAAFAEHHVGNARFVIEPEQWIVNNGRYWKHGKNAAQALAKRTSRSIWKEMTKKARTLDGPQQN